MDVGRQPFDLDAPFVAREAFVHGGRAFKAGQPFPWRELGCDDLQLSWLWGAALVDCDPVAATAPDVQFIEPEPSRAADPPIVVAPAPVKPPKPQRARAGA